MNETEKKPPLTEAEIQAKLIKKEIWQENLMYFFDKISFLRQTPEQKHDIAINVKEQLNTGRLYWIEIILSSLIATFGLLQNSVAVIIGAMLIAPLLRPIQGIAYGISEGDSKLIWRASKLLIGSAVLSIGLALIVVKMLPVHTETSEILSRTAPNIFDLFIAIASAIIALLSLSFKKLSESVAGVAMAASLMPPLSVVGIELALGSFANAWGSFLLFFTNIIAILFVGAVVFIFYGFRPHKENSEKTAKNIGILTLVILILSIPLVSGLQKITKKIELEAKSKTFIAEILAEKIPAAEVNNIELHGLATAKEINLSGDIKLPENVEFFADIIDETTNELSQKLQKDVQLDLDIIRTASITSRVKESPLEIQISEAVKGLFDSHVADGILVRSDITKLPDSEDSWSVKVLYTLPTGDILEAEEKIVLQNYLNKKFDHIELKHFWVQLAESQPINTETTEEIDETKAQYTAKIEQFLQEKITENGTFKNLQVQLDSEKNAIQATVEIFIPIQNIQKFSETFSSQVTEFEETLSFEKKKISYQIFPFYGN